MKHSVRRMAAAALAGGLLLTGCTGEGDNTRATGLADHKNGARAPLPGHPSRPTPGAAEQQEQSEQENQEGLKEGQQMLSTFALDVDTASYGYARSTLKDGRLPEPRTVRPEEFINSFRQDYPQPEGDGFTVTVDGARTDSPDWSLLRVGLATRAEDRSEESRPPAALTFVIDISGSMGSPNRLDLVQESLGMMIDELRADDSIAVVTFSKRARTVLPMTRLGDSGGRRRIRGIISDLHAEGSTNLDAGLTEGYEQAVKDKRKGATNRVVLLSDALANTGSTDSGTILESVSEARREHGITLFGVGVGREYGDRLMEQLTNQGDGHTSYVADIDDSRKVFVEQLPRNIELRARDAKAQVAFDPSTVDRFTLIGYENREIADEDFRDDRVDGGEVGPGHTVTALYAVKLKEGAEGPVATAAVRWLEPDSRTPHEESGRIEADALRGRLDDSTPRLQLTAVVAYFADALRTGPGFGRESEHESAALPGAPSLEELERRARKLASTTEDPAVEELTEAIQDASYLMTREPAIQDPGIRD